MKTIRKAFAMAALTGAFLVAFMAMSAGTANADSVNWDAIAQCESGGNWSTNTGNGYYGGLQFSPATWRSNGGFGNPAHASRAEQIRVAENVLATQGLKAWPTCGGRGGAPFAGTGAPTTVGLPATGAWYPGKYLIQAISGFLAMVPQAR
jgi:hypothetical protein